LGLCTRIHALKRATQLACAPLGSPRPGTGEKRAPLCVAVNATAFDSGPSGARNLSVGLCAALLRAGVKVDVFQSATVDLEPLVADEFGAHPPPELWSERTIRVDPAHPFRRALMGPGWVRREVTPEKHDLFLTDYYPVSRTVPTAVIVHDLRYFSTHVPGSRARTLWFRAYYPRIARRADLVVTPTAVRGQEAITYLGVDRGRVVVMPIGPSARYRTAAPGRGPGSHLLAVGMADPRKGADLLCAAMRHGATLTDRLLPLIMTGRRSRHIDGILSRYSDLMKAGLLRYEGMVSEASLFALYQGAAALLHPSRYEGFGLPVLEAMSLGIPVIASPDAAVEEVAGSIATYLDPEDTVGWARSIIQVSDPSTASPRPDVAGIRRARSMGWDTAVDRLLTAIQTVLPAPANRL
jgi:glycosyltransferase involved in cell wall biosynthesis